MGGKEWLYIVIAACLIIGVGVPLMGSLIRSRDFKAQIRGKKPFRTLDTKQNRHRDALGEQANYESEKYIAELKSKQNFFGYK